MSIQQQVLDQWSFKACDETNWLSATVPGTVHTDLLRHGLIPDPFYGTNEHDLQWIDKKDWEYMSSFELPESWAAEMARVQLVFEGLDTYADVYVNGEHALSADNMFRAWHVDVKELLRAGSNNVLVRFRSPINEDLPKLEELGYDLPATNDQSELGGLGERKVSVFARKAPYHYGWDWGPRFVTSGIWREVRLEGWSVPKISDLYIRQEEISSEIARLTAVVEVDAVAGWNGRLRIGTEGMTWEQEVVLRPGLQTLTIEMVITDPKLWWCRGLGDPSMYSFQAALLQGGETISDRTVRTGLRSIELVREKDEAGASFYFKLNGVRVFMKGANHIPNDSFATEVTRERYRHEIVSAVESNMNMLRVWGGGIYEEEAFYELCDENGLLVWQDFMFACSMYPGNEAFLNNVAAEAEYNVRRLRNHPSIALWCGNNEIDSAWAHYAWDTGWGWKEKLDSAELRDKIWADYEAVFHRILPEAVHKWAPGTDYWPSSPLRSLTGDENQHATQITGEGDVHYWGVWHAVEPFDNYNQKIGRFMSEYGFQSFPELKTVLEYAEEDQLELESKVMLAHQKNGKGNQLIKEYMGQYLPEPRDFKSFLYMSQLLQAQAIQTAIEAHRRNKPYCMGTLYWQMNDCWPVASWAGMDYYGRWKALQYTVRRSFQDVMLSVDGIREGEVAIYLISDRQEPVTGVLKLSLFDFDGQLLRELSQDVAIGADAANIVLRIQTDEWLGAHNPKRVVLLAELEGDGAMLDSKPYYFESFREIEWPEASVMVEEIPGSEGTSFRLKTDALARQVWLSAEEEGIFTDNFFDLIPGVPHTVTFQRRSSGNEAFVPGKPGALTVSSMRDFIR
ncbi:beta-mannosidase [Paenibacillus woosongensis]|uniref:Beta-mannosidase B n=1 Tax=Paenibacillus woosongensis TaxID=307580 RepID=A0A7X2YZM3_9BACL|nr:glycoside hydrolase family 2 protein [Paenibacillus woosongensis]MUG44141.1 glycoside hydrolase family 2 protein [Paenibacillus woosongensis]